MRRDWSLDAATVHLVASRLKFGVGPDVKVNVADALAAVRLAQTKLQKKKP